MKSTIKIDYASGLDGGHPIIKIIRPKDVTELKEYSDGDYDVRDKLINDFLQTPCHVDYNSLFRISTWGMLEKAENYHVATIEPIKTQDHFYTFRHNILNKLVDVNTIIQINSGDIEIKNFKKDVPIPTNIFNYKKIMEFFDWVDEQEWVKFEK